MGTNSALAERIRVALTAVPAVREVPMFGALSFMVNDKMLVAAQASGDLLVRVAPEWNRELTALPGVGKAEMGSGRAMGLGWVSVATDVIAADAQLHFWIAVALEHNGQAVAARIRKQRTRTKGRSW
ncbi:TfoX/Sxy family protein [Nocardia sp. NBC_01730]|uniref:TfoX/Sxy family protein n=1 Tax=Nocardia sp. NBC_01730 TaxID=2975998 RepID=UPI002E108709|nr:TfoX/Sxy family protein [Nocardia sp. NBC_01730]